MLQKSVDLQNQKTNRAEALFGTSALFAFPLCSTLSGVLRIVSGRGEHIHSPFEKFPDAAKPLGDALLISLQLAPATMDVIWTLSPPGRI